MKALTFKRSKNNKIKMILTQSNGQNPGGQGTVPVINIDFS